MPFWLGDLDSPPKDGCASGAEPRLPGPEPGVLPLHHLPMIKAKSTWLAAITWLQFHKQFPISFKKGQVETHKRLTCPFLQRIGWSPLRPVPHAFHAGHHLPIAKRSYYHDRPLKIPKKERDGSIGSYFNASSTHHPFLPHRARPSCLSLG